MPPWDNVVRFPELPPIILHPLAKDAKLVCDGLGVRSSVSFEDGELLRASRLIVRIGLEERVSCMEGIRLVSLNIQVNVTGF